MDNYKIRVNNEAESREAQELFFELGYEWISSKKCITKDKEIYADEDGDLSSTGTSRYKFETISPPQLRDLVAQSKSNEQGLISGADAKLVENSKKFITADHLNRFQAAQAHLQGEPVQFMTANGDFIDITDNSTLGIFATDGGYSFRLKPRTIKLEIEIPAPFEPKVGEEYYYPYSHSERGYALDVFKGGRITNQFGAWRKEAEIKIVVEQLRKLKEHSK